LVAFLAFIWRRKKRTLLATIKVGRPAKNAINNNQTLSIKVVTKSVMRLKPGLKISYKKTQRPRWRLGFLAYSA